MCTCVYRRIIIHLPQRLFIVNPQCFLTSFFNCQKFSWDLKALDRYHDATFNNDNLGKRANIISNHLLTLDKTHTNGGVGEEKDFTERDYIRQGQIPSPNFP